MSTHILAPQKGCSTRSRSPRQLELITTLSTCFKFTEEASALMIYSLYIINKAGGLVYQKDFNQQLEKLSSNEYLVLAGTFHG